VRRKETPLARGVGSLTYQGFDLFILLIFFFALEIEQRLCQQLSRTAVIQHVAVRCLLTVIERTQMRGWRGPAFRSTAVPASAVGPCRGGVVKSVDTGSASRCDRGSGLSVSN